MNERNREMKKLVWCIMVVCVGILCYADEQTTEEIVVTATKTEHEVKDLSGNVSIITAEEIKQSGAGNVDEILRHEAGLDMQGQAPAVKAKLNLRGVQGNYGAQRVLVLIDGRPVNEEYLGDVDFRLLPTDNIEQIEIVRGPSSALYGSNAIGGVINLISKRTDKELSANLKTFVGSFNTYGTITQHGMKLGSLDYFLTAHTETTDGYLKNTDGSNKDWQSDNFTGKVNYALDKVSLISLSLGNYTGEGNEENFIRDITRNYVDAVYRTNWATDKEANLSARVYRNGLDQNLKWKGASTAPYEQYTIGVNIQQSYKIIEGHLLTGGIDVKKEDARVEELNGTIDESINSSALYVQDEITLNKQLLLTAGVRYDDHEVFGSEISPRVGVVYHFDDKLTIRGAVGKAYRAPAISDMYLPATVYFGMTFEGSTDVEPETMWTIEAGADYKFTEQISSRLTVYKSILDNAWDYMKDPDNVFRPHNVTQNSIFGIEAETNYEVIKGLTAFANYTFNRAIYAENKSNPLIEDNYVEDIPASQGNLGVNWKPGLSAGGEGKDNTVVGLKVNAASSRYTDPENTHANRLPHYLTADINLSTQVNEYSSIQLTINNIFDRQYAETTEYMQPGRWFSASAAIRF
jgi:outer membrane receptor for ferrienterochelin and colicin